MKSCDVFWVQQLELEPAPSFCPFIWIFWGRYVYYCCHSISVPHQGDGCSQGQAVDSVLSWLPQGQCHWNCCKAAFCLSQGLNRNSQFPPGTLSIQSGAQRCVCCWEVFCKTPGKHTWASFLPVGFQYLVKMRSWSWGTCTAPSAFCPCVAGQSHLIKLSLTVLAFYTAAATPKDAVKPCRNQRRASKW